MSKSTYIVVVIQEGRERDYSDFEKRGININAFGEQLHSGLLSFNVEVEAKNKQEAVSLVRKMHPGLSIDTDATQRLG
ncbi:MAG: hypothetical protein Q8L15_10720 [Methylobacter sp.]|nr:hypothetical protein [Methylobacter sp.]